MSDRTLGWRWITGSGIAFLFGFNVLLLLGTTVLCTCSIKTPSIAASSLTQISIVFLALCSCAARMILMRHFCYWSSAWAPHCATPFLSSKVVIVLELLPVLSPQSPLVWSTHSCSRILWTISDVWDAMMLCELDGQLHSFSCCDILVPYISHQPSLTWCWITDSRNVIRLYYKKIYEAAERYTEILIAASMISWWITRLQQLGWLEL